MMRSTLATIVVSGIAALSATSLASGTAEAGGTDWDKDWTALTVSHTGAWGTHTSPSRVDAMIGAMADCRENAKVTGSGCGARITTVRAGWSAAYVCGTETFIVIGATFAEVNAAAVNREIELREIEQAVSGPCRRLVAIGPNGEPAASETLSEVLPLIPDRPEVAGSEDLH